MSLADRIAQQPQPVRRALALLLLFSSIIVIWQLLVAPLRRVLTSERHWRVAIRRTLAEARGRAIEVPTLQRRLSALPDATVWQRFYPDGDSVNSDNALREDIARGAAAAGVMLRTITPLPTSKRAGLTKLAVVVSADMTIGQLTDFLIQLRDSRRYLRVDALRIMAPQVQVTNRNHHLLVRLQIVGYARSTGGGGE